MNNQSPEVAVDIVIFNLINNRLHVLLIKMSKNPYLNKWALPGGLVKHGESLDGAALKNLLECTSVKDIYLKQFHSFGDPERDVTKHVISVAYFAILHNPELKIINDPRYSDINWFDIKILPKLAYDHGQIIKTAIEHLQNELQYTDIAFKLLPEEFTFRELQSIHEIILDKKSDKRNFRKQTLAKGIIKELNKVKLEGKYRSRLYSQL